MDAPGWFRAGRNDPHLVDIAAAVWEDQRIVVGYRHPGEGAAVRRHLDPLGLVCKAGTWYLVARRGGELRTYRVSRVEDVSLLEERFERPASFDLASYWSESVAEFEAIVPDVQVVVDTSPRGLDDLGQLVRGGGSVLLGHDEPGDGWTRCHLRFESLDDAYADLIRLGADVEVIEPAGLRQRIVHTADAMRARYAGVS